MPDDRRSPPDESDANRYLAMGAGIGVLGAVTAAVGAAVCPVCVVVAPTFLGVGAFKKWREREQRRRATCDAPDQTVAAPVRTGR